jgi:glycosyltransferase involved in cell wall biosynthesis
VIDNLLISKTNSYGLSHDVVVMTQAIEAADGSCAHVRLHERSLRHRIFRSKIARRAFHLERAHRIWFSAAVENVLVPNQERFPRRHLGRLGNIDRVLAKTRHAESIFAGLGVATDYLGFTSQDRHLDDVHRDWRRVLHVAGGSTLKGTEEVLALWAKRPDWPELVLVQKRANAPPTVAPNVRLCSGYLDASELRRLQNACGIHLCPSRAEGWGHNVVEGLSCGALVITTNAPPMNEHVTMESGLLVPTLQSAPRHLGTSYFVDPAALEMAIDTALTLSSTAMARMSEAARAAYQAIDTDFRKRFTDLV